MFTNIVQLFYKMCRLGSQWSEEICYRETLTEISRLPPRPAVAVTPILTASAVPKKIQEDPTRRDSGMSTGSSEMESGDPVDAVESTSSNQEDMAGWWEPRVKVNLADQLPGDYIILFNYFQNISK